MAILWQDRKRVMGMPLTFTRYELMEDRLILKEGFLRSVENEIMLYRVQDITLLRTLGEKLFGVGTLEVRSSDKSHPVLRIEHVKKPRQAKEILSKRVEEERARRRVGTHEFISDDFDAEEA